ncbi:hypothetical protein D3C74_270380 [compost metagenome]
MTQIFTSKTNILAAENDLHRLILPTADEISSKYLMPLRQMIQAILENIRLEASVQIKGRLFKIST